MYSIPNSTKYPKMNKIDDLTSVFYMECPVYITFHVINAVILHYFWKINEFIHEVGSRTTFCTSQR